MVNNKDARLLTERLLLRIPEIKDAVDIQHLAGAWEVAETTGAIPHPYEDGMAEDWIQGIHDQADDSLHYTFAMIRREDNQLVGVCGFTVEVEHESAEIGYWVGKLGEPGGDFTSRGFLPHAATDRPSINVKRTVIIHRMVMTKSVPARQQSAPAHYPAPYRRNLSDCGRNCPRQAH